MKYSLAKIAKELGVSKSAVSLVINGKAREARISTELEETIKNFCKEVNYVPNIHAQRINQKFVRNIGFLVNQSVKVDDNNPFADYNINGIFGGIVLEAESERCRVSVQLYNSDIDENRVFEWLRSSEIDGLIYYGISIPDKWRKIFVDENRYVVGIGIEPDEKIASVNTDNFTSSYNLTRHLISEGRRSFVYLAGMENSFVAEERRRGFLAACMECEISLDNVKVFYANFSEQLAEKVIAENKFLPDAVVCANDDMAIGAMKALKKLGVNVPEQVAVAGGDDISIAKYFSPSLTTFSNNQHELGRLAAQTVINMIKGDKPKNIIISGDLIIREST